MGFSPDDVISGFRAIVDERAERRADLRGDPETVKQRQRTVLAAAILLPISIWLMYTAKNLRVQYAPGKYGSGYLAITMMFTGVCMGGAQVVLLLRSPLRIPLAERLFRLAWLGPFGRSFVRFGQRNVKGRQTPARLPSLPPPSTISRATSPVVAQTSAASDRLATLEQRVSDLEAWRVKSS
jgi:hypothetical protein